jgi:hypothetical protein
MREEASSRHRHYMVAVVDGWNVSATKDEGKTAANMDTVHG